MKRKYAILVLIGTVLPNIFAVKESIRSGNILLYAHPLDTVKGMFANNISSAFAIDLLVIVVFFLVWSFQVSKRLQIKYLGWIWVYTFAFGIAGGLPLFLYFREVRRSASPTSFPSEKCP